MIKFTLYASSTSGNLSNCIYPREIVVTDESSMLDAIKYDHVSAKFKNNYRSKGNFTKSDNAVLDCDNDHSDDPKDWVDVEDVTSAFHDSFGSTWQKSYEAKRKEHQARFHVHL